MDANSALRINYTASGRGFAHPIVVDAGHPVLSFAIARRAAEDHANLSLAEAQAEIRQAFRKTDALRPDAMVPASTGTGVIVTDVSATLARSVVPAVSVHIAVDRTWRRDDGRSVVVRVWQPLADLAQN